MGASLLTGLIPVPPLVAFFVIMLFTRRSKPVSDWIAVGAMGLAWLASLAVFFQAIATDHLGEHPITAAVPWLPTGQEKRPNGRWKTTSDVPRGLRRVR